jgi:glycosidase
MILTFDFDFMGSVVNGILAEDASDIQGVYERFSEQFPPGAGQATFVSNHDVPRLATRLNGDPQALRLAAMLLMTLPGTPFVYYGQELGLPNGPGPQDEQKRLPMPWKDLPGVGFSAGTPWIAPQAGAAALSVLTQQRNPESLLNLYRRMIRLRKSHPALLRGGMSSATIQSSSSGDTWAFFRTLPDSRVLVVVNMGTEPAENVSIEYPVPEKALQVKPAAILVNPQVVSHARGSEATETVLFPSATTLSRSRHSLMIANIAPRSLVVIDLREEAR